MFFLKKNFFNLLIIFTPLIIFLINSKNYVQVNIKEIQYLITFLFILFFILLVLTELIKKLFYKLQITKLDEKIFLFLSLSFLIFFSHDNLREFLYIPGFIRRPFFYISFAILTLINIAVGFVIFNNFNIVKKTAINFILILILFNFFQEFTLYNKDPSLKKKEITKNINEINFPKSAIKNNIYFVIMDAMSSLEYFEKNYIRLEKLKNENIKQNNLISLQNSTSSYNMTYLTLSSIIYGNYPIDDKHFIGSRNFFFPNMIYYNDPNDLGIITYLNNFDNDFKYVGNTEYNLTINKKSIAINDQSQITETFNNLFQTIFFKFFKPSPFDEIVRGISTNFLKINSDVFIVNDAVGKFLEYLEYSEKEQKNTFYLIHHMSPHPPFIYDKNCSKINEIIDFKVGYEKAYKCALIKIGNLSKFINKKDPNAFIVFLGDHGASNIDHKIADRFKVITLVKPNSYCKNFNFNKTIYNTVNMLRAAIFCSAHETPSLVENKNYIGYYEDEENYGAIKEININ